MASWTNPTILTTGAPLPSTAYNDVANNTTFLYQKPYASYSTSSGIPCASGANVQVVLSINNFSGYGMSLSTGDIIVPLAGIYQINYRIGYFGASVGGGYSQVYLNGGAILYGSWATFDGATILQSNGAGLLPCAVGDALQLVAFQNSGSTVNTATTSAQTALEVFFVGSV